MFLHITYEGRKSHSYMQPIIIISLSIYFQFPSLSYQGKIRNPPMSWSRGMLLLWLVRTSLWISLLGNKFVSSTSMQGSTRPDASETILLSEYITRTFKLTIYSRRHIFSSIYLARVTKTSGDDNLRQNNISCKIKTKVHIWHSGKHNESFLLYYTTHSICGRAICQLVFGPFFQRELCYYQ